MMYLGPTAPARAEYVRKASLESGGRRYGGCRFEYSAPTVLACLFLIPAAAFAFIGVVYEMSNNEPAWCALIDAWRQYVKRVDRTQVTAFCVTDFLLAPIHIGFAVYFQFRLASRIRFDRLMCVDPCMLPYIFLSLLSFGVNCWGLKISSEWDCPLVRKRLIWPAIAAGCFLAFHACMAIAVAIWFCMLASDDGDRRNSDCRYGSGDVYPPCYASPSMQPPRCAGMGGPPALASPTHTTYVAGGYQVDVRTRQVPMADLPHATASAPGMYQGPPQRPMRQEEDGPCDACCNCCLPSAADSSWKREVHARKYGHYPAEPPRQMQPPPPWARASAPQVSPPAAHMQGRRPMGFE